MGPAVEGSPAGPIFLVLDVTARGRAHGRSLFAAVWLQRHSFVAPGCRRDGHAPQRLRFGRPPASWRGSRRRAIRWAGPATEPVRQPGRRAVPRPPPGQPYPVSTWFRQADASGDGKLTHEEFVADAARFFQVLDANHDGVIDGLELKHY